MADKTINVRHVQKHDTENNWTSKNPVLLAGEIAFTTDGTNAGKYKLGDGASKWSALSYAKAKLEKADVTGALGYTPPQKDTTYSTATSSVNGLMSKTDKAKLDEMTLMSVTDFETLFK
nr:MAG TPA: hyaluronidase [Caudoviricetes sp.]